MHMTVTLQVWDSVLDIPTDVRVDVDFDAGQADTYDEQGYGPDVDILSTDPPGVRLDGYTQEIIWLCEDELRERRMYFINQQRENYHD